MPNIASQFIGFFKKTANFDKNIGAHHNGDDNLYAETVESVIANSVTASRGSSLMSSYISGKGFGQEDNNLIVNSKKGTSLFQFLNEVADSITDQNGVFIHLNYNSIYEIDSMDVLPFSDCRVGKKDDEDYIGKILVCKDWSDKSKAKKPLVLDIYNPLESVIQAQMEASGGVKKYKGQVFYFKTGKYIYPISRLHPALKDADSESQVSIYKNTSLRKGFFGKTLVVTKPLVDSRLSDSEDEQSRTEYSNQKDSRESFRSTIKDFVGAENSDGVLHIELEMESDKLEDEILFKNIESNIDDKLFAHTETSVSDNIRMCFNNIPAALIRSSDGALFGSSGDSIRAMKEFYQEQTERERMIVQEICNRLMSRFVSKRDDLKIIPLIKKEELEEQKKNMQNVK